MDQTMTLRALQPRVDERLRAWQEAGFAIRLWQKDPTLWFPVSRPELTDRLGWLELPATMPARWPELAALRDEVKAEGLAHVVLLGMGGSSLAPEVFQRTFGNAAGCPELIVLDSTHPDAVKAVEAQIVPRRTLFLVSSKSGTTTEMMSFFYYFWERVARLSATPGHHFVAITDPGTPLERLAAARGFRKVFPAPPDVGGRYSALTVFGLVPAALIGVDGERLLERAARLAEACGPSAPVESNPGLELGAALGEAGLAGRDKVTLLASPTLAALPSWIEQLIAESTGKEGKGLVPVVDEPPRRADGYGGDRMFCYLRLEGDDNEDLDRLTGQLEEAGHPLVRLHLAERADLGQEFFRWEVAIAAAGAVLGIHPFDQPDVQLAKELAHKAMQPGAGDGGDEGTVAQHSLAERVSAWRAQARPGEYFAIHAYLAPSAPTTATLQQARAALGHGGLATTLGYGPRFLHSTGQLHKGGPNTGLFLQLVDQPADPLPVPETDYTFAALIHAQALGDYRALQQRGRRVLRLDLGKDPAAGLAELLHALAT